MEDYLTERDVPLLRSAGFSVSPSGGSYFGYDRKGQQWQVHEDLSGNAPYLSFWTMNAPNAPRDRFGRMSRQMFETLFTKKESQS